MKKIILLSSISASLLLAASINFSEANSSPNRVSPSKNDVILSFHSSIENAKKSVVNISTSKKIKRNQDIEEMLNHPFLREFFGKNFKIPQSKQKASSLGSGVIISSDGYIVTNNHVVEDADEILVTLLDTQKEYKAKIIGLDPDSDLAVIKIEEKNLHNISFANSSNLLEGDVVFAIGNPFGVGGSVTQGIVSALNKSGIGLNNYENFIQTDASINPGNSGGALVDSRGALVGINSAILSRSGGNNGIGFAIPSNMVKTVTKALIQSGKIDRGYMGVSISDLTQDMKEVYTNKFGALVLSVQKDEPAYEAGLKRGDLIIKVDDKHIQSANELKNLIGSKKPKQKVKITYERDNEIKHATVKLNQNLSTKVTQNINSSKYLEGLSLVQLNEQAKLKYKIPQQLKGVLITDVEENSKSQKAGFMKNDIIVQVEQNVIENLNDLQDAFENTKKQKIRVWINRNGHIFPVLAKK